MSLCLECTVEQACIENGYLVSSCEMGYLIPKGDVVHSLIYFLYDVPNIGGFA
jgi:hypothetical protein